MNWAMKFRAFFRAMDRRRLRILITNIGIAERTGTEVVAMDLALGLARLGHFPMIWAPRVDPAVLDRLISAFNPAEGRAICLPVWEGKRGNPVLWAKRFFPEMGSLAGDVGARHLIGQYAELVAEVPMPDDSVLLDIDTPEALAIYRQRPA